MATLSPSLSPARLPRGAASLDNLVWVDRASADLTPLAEASRLPVAQPGLALVDPLAAIAAELRRVRLDRPISTLHVVAHGRPGAIQLNGTWLDRLALAQSAPVLAEWDVTTIVLWSCRVGADPAFVALLQELTGARVWASSELLGPAHSTVMDGSGYQLTDVIDQQALNAWNGQLGTVDVQGKQLSFGTGTRLTTSASANTLKGVYLYDDVYTDATTGLKVDALVALTGKTNASVSNFDNPSLQYAETGYFQPTLTIQGSTLLPTAVGGSANFLFQFVVDGSVTQSASSMTNSLVTFTNNEMRYNGNLFYTPCTLTNVGWTSYDIDGYSVGSTATDARQYVLTDQYSPGKVTTYYGPYDPTDPNSSQLIVDTATTPGSLCVKSATGGDATDTPGSLEYMQHLVTVGMASTDKFNVTFGDLAYTGSAYTAYFSMNFGPQSFGTPKLKFSKDIVGSKSVQPYTPVTFEYTVTAEAGSFSGSSVKITDDNATPTFLPDDFGYDGANPLAGGIQAVYKTSTTYNIGDTNENGNVDTGENWKYQATVIPPITIEIRPPVNSVPTTFSPSGIITWKTLTNSAEDAKYGNPGDIRLMYRQSQVFNDNTYGTGSDSGWLPDTSTSPVIAANSANKTHTFRDLTGSDKANWRVYYADGTVMFEMNQDYISASGVSNGTNYSGFQSLGFSGGDGSWVSGSTTLQPYLKNFDSTLEYNLNRTGGYTLNPASGGYTKYINMTLNTPTRLPYTPYGSTAAPTGGSVTAIDPNWDQIDGYDFTISKEAFASKGFGGAFIYDQHNSPAKIGGSNSYYPSIVYSGSTNTAVVAATPTSGGDPLTATASATVQISQPQPKFFVADSGADKAFTYRDTGAALGSFALNTSVNNNSRDIAANADASKIWVLDSSKNVGVYAKTSSGYVYQGAWSAASTGTPEGVTYDKFGATDAIWTSTTTAVQWYLGAASATSGSKTASASFSLNVTGELGSTNVIKGIVTDGSNNLYIVTNGSTSSTTDKIWRYQINRDGSNKPTSLTRLGVASLGPVTNVVTNYGLPTGITLDPTNASNDLWIVSDGPTPSGDAYFRFTNGRALSGGTPTAPLVITASSRTNLVSANTAPQGIADPDLLIGASGAVSQPEGLGQAVLPSGSDPIFNDVIANSQSRFQAPFGPTTPAGFNPVGTPSATSSLGIGTMNYRGLETNSWMQHMASTNPFAASHSGF